MLSYLTQNIISYFSESIKVLPIDENGLPRMMEISQSTSQSRTTKSAGSTKLSNFDKNILHHPHRCLNGPTGHLELYGGGLQYGQPRPLVNGKRPQINTCPHYHKGHARNHIYQFSKAQ
ncbi:hypothetical protein HAX54_039108 [Datura stramonium]|uniref:Uncharacterized protein n=1 Tax=Datura stramonium TaxID=4076 RepID=A0ABS8SIV8_DATST|nr:hypothetical protein [Datura stramonium]